MVDDPTRLRETSLRELSDVELYARYDDFSNYSNDRRMFLYSIELQRRNFEVQLKENRETNKIMRKWTIAIGVMTGIMLICTIINIFIP